MGHKSLIIINFYICKRQFINVEILVVQDSVSTKTVEMANSKTNAIGIIITGFIFLHFSWNLFY